MAFKVSSDCIVSKSGPVSVVHFRNFLKWKKVVNGRESYGFRLILSSVNNPTAYSILSCTYSVKDPLWVSLVRSLGLDPANKDVRKDLQDLLMGLNTISVRDLNHHAKAEILSVDRDEGDHPGPVYIDMLSEGQRKFLGNCFYIAFRRAGSKDTLPAGVELSTNSDKISSSDLEGI